MRNLGILILVVFIGLSSFGVFGMHALMQKNDGDCVAATFQDADCPLQAGSLDYLNFHLDAYKGFSLGLFSENITGELIFSLLLIGSLILFYSFRIKFVQLIISKQRYRFRNSFVSHQKQNINKWLARLENSPAVFS